MEQIEIFLGDDERYHEAVHCGVAELGDLRVITKDHAMVSGRPGVCISFTIVDPETGQHRRVQATTTVRNFMLAADAMRGRYGQA